MLSPNLTPIPELYVSYDSAQKLKKEAAELTSWDLTARQTCDLELLMNGGFNPDGSYTAYGTNCRPLVSTDLLTWRPDTIPAATPSGLPLPPPGYKYITSRAISSATRLFFCIQTQTELSDAVIPPPP